MEYIHKKKKIPIILSLINKVRVARDRREHSSDDHSEPSGKTGSTPSIGQRTSSGGAKSLKSLKSMRSYVQSATGEIYPPNMRIRGVSLQLLMNLIFPIFINLILSDFRRLCTLKAVLAQG